MMTDAQKQAQVAQLITAIEGSFSRGYLFYTKGYGQALVTTSAVLAALVRDDEIIVVEPDHEWSHIFHKAD